MLQRHLPPSDTFLSYNELCQRLLHADNIRPALELAFDGHRITQDVDLHLRIHIKSPCGLYREVADGAIGDGVILGFLARETLLVNEDKPLIGEDKEIAYDPETP